VRDVYQSGGKCEAGWYELILYSRVVQLFSSFGAKSSFLVEPKGWETSPGIIFWN
jgi:hypothetical protein